MKRFAVTTSFYVYAKTEEEAIYKAKYMAIQQDRSNDDGCSVDAIRNAEFGKIERTVIYSKN